MIDLPPTPEARSVGAVGVGVLLDSPAMQWAGAMAWILALFAKASGKRRLTIAEARARLDEIETEQAHG